MEYRVCSSCSGKGRSGGIPCPRCDGMGRILVPLRAIAIKKQRRAVVGGSKN